MLLPLSILPGSVIYTLCIYMHVYMYCVYVYVFLHIYVYIWYVCVSPSGNQCSHSLTPPRGIFKTSLIYMFSGIKQNANKLHFRSLSLDIRSLSCVEK